MIEIPGARTRHSKLYELAPGQFRLVQNSAPLHWWNKAQTAWADNDLTWVLNGAQYEITTASYIATFDPATFVLHYTSRTGHVPADLRIRLTSIGGTAPVAVTAQIFGTGDRIRFIGIGGGVDLLVIARPNGPELYRRLIGPTFPLILWDVDESLGIGAVRTNFDRITGVDNWDGSAPGRETEDRKQRPVEITVVRSADVVTARRRYSITEQLTGRTKLRNPTTHVMEWSNSLAFPVLVDVQIIEDLPADLDDGHAYASSSPATTEKWYDSYNNITFGVSYDPAWRFTTVAIPQGATIDAASLRLFVVTTGAAASSLFGEAIDNAAQWAALSNNGPNRMTRTTASIAFDTFNATGFTTRDVKTIIQEIVNRVGWASNNALRLGVIDTGTGGNVGFRPLNSPYPTQAAQLTIDYSTSGIPFGVTSRIVFKNPLTQLLFFGRGQARNFDFSIPSATQQYTQPMTASLSFVGATSQQTMRGLSAVLSYVGGVVKRTSRAQVGTLSFVGLLASIKAAVKLLTGTLSFSGSTTKQPLRALSGGLSFSGAIQRLAARGYAATLSFSGAFAKQVRRSLSAALSFTGGFTTGSVFNRALTGTLSFVGTLSPKSILTRAFTATLSFTGTFSKQPAKATTGTLSFSGTTSKRTGKVQTGVLSFAGAIAKRASRAFAAALSFTGAMISARLVLKALAATLSFAGAINKRIGKQSSGSLSFSGGIGKRIARAFAGVLAFLGGLISFGGSGVVLVPALDPITGTPWPAITGTGWSPITGTAWLSVAGTGWAPITGTGWPVVTK